MTKSDKNIFLFYFLAFLIAVPIFIQINSSGISFINNYKASEGVPISIGIFAIILLFFRKLQLKLIILLIFIFYYALVSYFDSTYRSLNVFQGFIFIISFYVLDSLSSKEINSLAINSLFIIKLFICLHVISIFYSANYSYNEYRSISSLFYGFSIYQAYLTYPLVMLFSLFLFEILHLKKNLSYYLFHLFPVIFLIVLMERRTAIALLITYMILFNRKLFTYIFIFTFSLFLIFEFDYTVLSENIFRRVFDFGGYLYTRADTWSYSISIISDYKLFLFGNGINNYSHNLILHIISAQGIIYFLVIMTIIIYILRKVFNNSEISKSEIIFISVIILIDWNVNTNIYLPYYAVYLALVFSTITKRSKLLDYKDVNN